MLPEVKKMFEALVPKVKRRYDTYQFQNACVMNVRQRSLMNITKDHAAFIHKASKQLSNLEVKRSDGKPLFVCPSKDIEANKELKLLVETLTEKEGGNPILIFLKRYDDKKDDEKPAQWLDEIDVSWTEELGDLSSNKKSEGIEKKGFMQDSIVIKREINYRSLEDANHYLELRTTDKYETTNVEFIGAGEEPLKNDQFEQLITDKHDKVYRFKDDDKRPDYVRFHWHIGIPRMILTWVKFGALFGIIVPTIGLFLMLSFTNFFYTHHSLVLQFVGGVIAALLGLRLLLFHDIELMKVWSGLYIFLICWGIFVTAMIVFVILPLYKVQHPGL